MQAEGNYRIHFWMFNFTWIKKKELQWVILLRFYFILHAFFFFFFNWAHLVSLCSNQKKKKKRMQSLPTPAERPWDETQKGNWINPLSVAPPVEQVGPTLEGPCWLSCAAPPCFGRRPFCLPKWVFTSLSAAAWTAPTHQDQVMEIVPHNLSVKVMHISDRHTQAEAADRYGSPSLRAAQL